MRRHALAGALALTLPLLLAPIPHAAGVGDFTAKRGVVYSSPDGVDLRMNIYTPDDGKPVHPAVLCVHGGGWAHGGLAAASFQAQYLAKRGFVAFTLEYRLAPQNTWPAQWEDVSTAVKWIRDHAGELKVDPARIGALGGSAGGHLVGLLATMGEGPLDTGARIRAGVSWSGPMDLAEAVRDDQDRVTKVIEKFLGCSPDQCPDTYNEASPVSHVDQTDAALFFTNGTGERIPLQGAEEMANALEKAKVPHEFVNLPEPCHSDQCQNLQVPNSNQNVIQASAAYLEKWLNAPVQQGSPPSVSPTARPSALPTDRSGWRSNLPLIVGIAVGLVLLVGLGALVVARRGSRSGTGRS